MGVRNFLNASLGFASIMLLALILVTLLNTQTGTGPAAQPVATTTPPGSPTPITPTPMPLITETPIDAWLTPPTPLPPTPTPEFPYGVQVVRRYPLEVEGPPLDGNDWAEYKVPLFSPDGALMLFRKPAPVKAERGPDCQGWACRMPLHELWRTDAQGKAPLLLAEEVGSEAWSPNSQRIAYSQHDPKGASALWIMRAAGEEKTMVANNLGATYIGWIDASSVVYLNESGSVTSVDIGSGSATQIKPSELPAITRLAISPQGDRAVFATEAEAWLVPFDTLKPVTITPYNGAFWGDIAWSPDNTRVAYASRSSVFIVDRDGNAIDEVNTAWEPNDLAWSPDGKLLAFIGRTEERSFSYEVYLVDAEGTAVKQITHDNENVMGGGKWTLTWSPDGNKLIYGTDELPGQKIWVIEIATSAM